MKNFWVLIHDNNFKLVIVGALFLGHEAMQWMDDFRLRRIETIVSEIQDIDIIKKRTILFL